MALMFTGSGRELTRGVISLIQSASKQDDKSHQQKKNRPPIFRWDEPDRVPWFRNKFAALTIHFHHLQRISIHEPSQKPDDYTCEREDQQALNWMLDIVSSFASLRACGTCMTMPPTLRSATQLGQTTALIKPTPAARVPVAR